MKQILLNIFGNNRNHSHFRHTIDITTGITLLVILYTIAKGDLMTVIISAPFIILIIAWFAFRLTRTYLVTLKRNLPLWLWFGVVGIWIALVSNLIFFSCAIVETQWPETSGFLCLPFMYFTPLLPFVFLTDMIINPVLGYQLSMVLLPIFSIAGLFLLGTISGQITELYKKQSR